VFGLFAITVAAVQGLLAIESFQVSAMLLASAASLANSPAELIDLITTIILLSLRSWIGVTNVGMTRRMNLWLTNLTITLVVLFFVLMFFRFKTLGG
jgi:hypothetical protein